MQSVAYIRDSSRSPFVITHLIYRARFLAYLMEDWEEGLGNWIGVVAERGLGYYNRREMCNIVVIGEWCHNRRSSLHSSNFIPIRDENLRISLLSD